MNGTLMEQTGMDIGGMRSGLVRGELNETFVLFVLLTILTELRNLALSDHKPEDRLGEMQGTGKTRIG